MPVTYRLEGLGKLEDALKELAASTSTATARNASRRGLIEAAQPMVERARELAPKEHGDLAASITAAASLSNKVGAAEYAAVLREGGSVEDAVAALRTARREAKGSQPALLVFVGPAAKSGGSRRAEGSLAHLVEFGSKPHTILPKGGAFTGDGHHPLLAWPAGKRGGPGFATRVDHPGAKPQPFMRPAFEETKDQVIAAFKPKLAAQIQAAAERAARKALRAGGGAH